MSWSETSGVNSQHFVWMVMSRSRTLFFLVGSSTTLTRASLRISCAGLNTLYLVLGDLETWSLPWYCKLHRLARLSFRINSNLSHPKYGSYSENTDRQCCYRSVLCQLTAGSGTSSLFIFVFNCDKSATITSWVIVLPVQLVITGKDFGVFDLTISPCFCAEHSARFGSLKNVGRSALIHLDGLKIDVKYSQRYLWLGFCGSVRVNRLWLVSGCILGLLVNHNTLILYSYFYREFMLLLLMSVRFLPMYRKRA